jgi:hypothetical protein
MLTAALFACALLAGCQSTSNGGNNVPTRTKSFKYSNDDGSTQSSAVEIRTRSEFEGGVLIKDWIRANHPGYLIAEQEIIRDTVLKKAYNMITIVDPNNNSKRVYFDITAYYHTMTTQFPDSRAPIT